MAAHSAATHPTHSSTHVTHPEHAWPTEKCLEYLIRIHFTCKKLRINLCCTLNSMAKFTWISTTIVIIDIVPIIISGLLFGVWQDAVGFSQFFEFLFLLFLLLFGGAWMPICCKINSLVSQREKIKSIKYQDDERVLFSYRLFWFHHHWHCDRCLISCSNPFVGTSSMPISLRVTIACNLNETTFPNH